MEQHFPVVLFVLGCKRLNMYFKLIVTVKIDEKVPH